MKNQNLVITAGTHNGPIHADDVVAAAILRLIYPGIEFKRTRDAAVLADLDVIFDVGGVYDPAIGRYDHHQDTGLRRGQRDGEEGAHLASAGLIWRNFGPEAIAASGIDLGGTSLARVHQVVDQDFMSKIDSLDTGAGNPGTGFTISHLVGAINPNWNEDPQESDFMSAFEAAVGMLVPVIKLMIKNAAAQAAAEEIVAEAVQAMPRDERILVLDRFAPWQSGVARAEGVLDQPLLYVVFPAPGGKQWNVQCVPGEEAFSKRKALPEAWAPDGKGFRGADLAAVTGVSDAVFCHGGRFIAGADSKEGAYALAQLAVVG
jgi:uncharacterized UPF0160 family protein